MCGCEYCIYDKSIYSSLLSWRDQCLEKLKYQSINSQNRSSDQKSICIYETYKNTVMPYERHIYVKASDMAKDKMCAYPKSYHVLSHRKCVL